MPRPTGPEEQPTVPDDDGIFDLPEPSEPTPEAEPQPAPQPAPEREPEPQPPPAPAPQPEGEPEPQPAPEPQPPPQAPPQPSGKRRYTCPSARELCLVMDPGHIGNPERGVPQTNPRNIQFRRGVYETDDPQEIEFIEKYRELRPGKVQDSLETKRLALADAQAAVQRLQAEMTGGKRAKDSRIIPAGRTINTRTRAVPRAVASEPRTLYPDDEDVPFDPRLAAAGQVEKRSYKPDGTAVPPEQASGEPPVR